MHPLKNSGSSTRATLAYVDEFVLTEFDIEKKWEEEKERKRQQKELEKNNQTMTTANTDNLFPPGKKAWLGGCYTKNKFLT